MRTILYKCDRCKTSLDSKSVIKMNINMQNGINPVGKKTFDFCKTCYTYVKSVFNNAIKSKTGDISKYTVSDDKPVTKMTDTEHITKRVSEKGAKEAGFVMGPLSDEERIEILRLFTEENLSAEEIANKMNRLPRGVKRALNTAMKKGELDKSHNEKVIYEENEQQIKYNLCKMQSNQYEEDKTSDEEYIPEQNSGSGASNAGVSKTSYTVEPKTDVINGRRYDIGGVLALAKAGWPSHKIAEERHYDENVVRYIIKKYM